MKEKVRLLGLDVHAETIAVAIAEPDGEVRSLGTIPNRAESIRKMIKKLGPADKHRVHLHPSLASRRTPGSPLSSYSSAIGISSSSSVGLDLPCRQSPICRITM
jgi:hypothetical protein